MKMMAFAVALFLLAQLAHSEDSTKSYLQVCTLERYDEMGAGLAMEFIAIVFAITAFSIGLAYMYSKVREDANLSVWAKDESQNLIISVFLMVGLIVFFSASCNIAMEYSGQDQFVASQSYLNSLISANGQNLVKSLISGSISNQLDATAYRYEGAFPFAGSGAAFKAFYRAHSAHKEQVIDLYIPILASLSAQKYMLQVIQWVGTDVLLPFGFVLRLLPPTRDYGNMVLALFFSLYIVVPTMYAMSGKVYSENIAIGGNNAATLPFYTSNEMFYSYGLDGPTPPDTRQTVFYRVGSTIPQAIFLPNLAIVVAVTCTMALSKALRAIAV